MDRFLAPHSPEAVAHSHLTENLFTWDTEHPSLNETLIAGCASYQAISRYLNGSDLYLLPRSRNELENVLWRYAYDAIHNTISQARSEISKGGYSRMCHLAESSVKKVLDENDNTAYLLSLHRPQPCEDEQDLPDLGAARFVRIK
ncbi:uncharacterized protein PHACADRAFT_249248 [Phanerochaete carnosa HHB-10118-sp]|uniref:Uncharacterized protein n=1 Tax=Phanerochaete carnosa (strain HHB-10118-sp) TaxID=650164 RepID=K5WI69_PHACS|nr:uncharacterized protein PHACADRAFT_249248 [Phanerochaete carnosa HHB-10118-sp]EKM59065.1 hypothetical protein PHACADRAFT_249248 [Phanerochaete carnosa HHB-10118-sp]